MFSCYVHDWHSGTGRCPLCVTQWTSTDATVTIRETPTPKLDEFIEKFELMADGNTQTMVGILAEALREIRELLKGGRG
jgi:hypothetical protein